MEVHYILHILQNLFQLLVILLKKMKNKVVGKLLAKKHLNLLDML